MQATSPIRILMVDDIPTNLKVLGEALQCQGWKALMAADGESAIEQVEYLHPDLILLDVMMPGIDGFETCRRLKANPNTQDVPVIFMTALSDSVDKVRGLELGAVDYITKPFQQEEVIARVKLHLRLSQLTHQLEQQVAQRTHSLECSLKDLQAAQIKLVQSEKMSTLGQMVAGIGHEINNPINFINGNIGYIQDYFQDLMALVQAYQTRLPDPDADLQRLLQGIDLPYLRTDLPKLVGSLQEGVTRLQDISLSLRTFARSDMTSQVDYQVEDGLNSTLMLLGHRLKADEIRPAIQVVKDYTPTPKVLCYPGQINQVLMNLLANAIDALEDSNGASQRSYAQIGADPNQITVRTEAQDQRLLIRIRDNGTGIPEGMQNKIFEPSFTTKAVGKGTGLGLPISRQIIEERHQGRLTCRSEVGVGTEFVISLPLQ
jgi:signal transduction histidine kinase